MPPYTGGMSHLKPPRTAHPTAVLTVPLSVGDGVSNLSGLPDGLNGQHLSDGSFAARDGRPASMTKGALTACCLDVSVVAVSNHAHGCTFPPYCTTKKGLVAVTTSPSTILVGMRGFEPPASASRTLRSSQTEPHPVEEVVFSAGGCEWQAFLWAVVKKSGFTYCTYGQVYRQSRRPAARRASPSGPHCPDLPRHEQALRIVREFRGRNMSFR